MRRFALTLLASLSVAVLTACSGYGGSGLGGGDANSYTQIVFATGAGGTNGIFKLAPASTTPLVVTAWGSKGSVAISQFNTTATWTNTYTFAPSFYQNQNSSNTQPTQVACPTAPSPMPGYANPANALVVQAPGTTAWVPYVAGTFYQTIGILPVPASGGLAPPAAPYCMIVVATASNGSQGSFIMVVTN